MKASMVYSAENSFVAPAYGKNWCDYIRDPVTGFISFPSFLKSYTQEFPALLKNYGAVGIAVGDVDNLKSCFQSMNEKNPWSFGHLAGNAFMSQLGEISLSAFKKLEYPWSALSTFGGDEMILVCAGKTQADFYLSVEDFHHELADQLPLTVSFAAGWFAVEKDIELPTQQDFAYLSASALSLVDRALLDGKNHIKEMNSTNNCTFIKKMQTKWLREKEWWSCN
ncbi:GGDEF domain-containing protein [Shimazuella sp. AN120528]|uniref:GGDEF domain-containing protein n=1 Tax=Shimazuella soli TaxID=1892854 RepID=UPI001F0E6244|nr:GGDEF domain-containing protein [Shimazuella soli]MCH5584854.1 GGDEF domain-containing protein [Shimazuella soli]